MSDLTRSTKISIVTPSFNQAAFIEDALWSVKRQDHANVEHIVMDGASTDGTVEILRRYSSQPGWEHLRWFSEPDRGQSDALNKGFRLATGEIVGWLNADDRYRPNGFTAIVQAFVQYSWADIVYGDYTWMDQHGAITQIRKEIAFSYFILLHHHTLYIPSTATFFRRRIFDEGDFIDENLHYSMDYEYFLRLANRGYRFKHIPSLLADFRWHAQSKTVAHVDGQFREFDEIRKNNSAILGGLPAGSARRTALSFLRAAAAAMRYSEKLVRGYYFDQFWPARGIRRLGLS